MVDVNSTTRFWIQGVVKDGQVVLEKPLDLPDGSVVTVITTLTTTRDQWDQRW